MSPTRLRRRAKVIARNILKNLTPPTIARLKEAGKLHQQIRPKK